MFRSALILVRSLTLIGAVVGIPIVATTPLREQIAHWPGGLLTLAGIQADSPSGQTAEENLVGSELQAGSGLAPAVDFGAPADRSNTFPATDSRGAERLDGPNAIGRLQRRLRSLGVNYMRLAVSEAESGRNCYHFQCRLPVDDNRMYSRPFEAQADDPLIAMQDVLGKLETWRAGRMP